MKEYFRKIQLAGLIALLAPALFLTSCNDNDDDVDLQRNIVEVINTDPDFSLLRAAIDKAGLTSALNTGTLTLFAPNDAAFRDAGLTAAVLETLSPADVAAVLRYHVVNGRQTAADLPTGTNTAVTALDNNTLYVTKNGTNVFVNGAPVVTADIGADNGIIHEIDGLLLPPAGDIVQTVIGDPNFSFLEAAVVRASQGTNNVAQVLAGAGPYTVFAPTNDAFINTTPYTSIEAITAADPDDLAAILTYHVVPGRVFSNNLTNGNVTTAQGGNVTINLGNGVQVTGAGNSGNAANVIGPNNVATNGVIHVIDRVLLPAN